MALVWRELGALPPVTYATLATVSQAVQLPVAGIPLLHVGGMAVYRCGGVYPSYEGYSPTHLIQPTMVVGERPPLTTTTMVCHDTDGRCNTCHTVHGSVQGRSHAIRA